MLLLLLLAKGWAITRMELTWKPLVFGIWMLYGIVHILLYVWNLVSALPILVYAKINAIFSQTEVDIIEDIDEYQTWPGWLILIFRTVIMGWFLLELRYTMLHEHNAQKLNFLLHFGASSLVWFIYLPIIALIALQISTLYRFKLILGRLYQ
jgi:Rhodopsin-like GPCR transmembrane domain